MNLSKETAEKMYASDIPSIKAFALENYPELGEKELPKTWEEFDIIVPKQVHNMPFEYYELWKLCQLRDRYNGEWRADWCNKTQLKCCITFYMDEVDTINSYSNRRVLYFKTIELRDKFLENFRDLIEIAKPLL